MWMVAAATVLMVVVVAASHRDERALRRALARRRVEAAVLSGVAALAVGGVPIPGKGAVCLVAVPDGPVRAGDLCEGA